MNRNSKFVPLTLAKQWWGLEPEAVRSWAYEDGCDLKPSAWGAAIGWSDLADALMRRGREVPAELARCRMLDAERFEEPRRPIPVLSRLFAWR